MAVSVKERLKTLSRELHIDFNKLAIRYVQERFLYRLSISDFKDYFVLKGALLLVIFNEHNFRPTSDKEKFCFERNKTQNPLAIGKNERCFIIRRNKIQLKLSFEGLMEKIQSFFFPVFNNHDNYIWNEKKWKWELCSHLKQFEGKR